jgi:hypothetical protein
MVRHRSGPATPSRIRTRVLGLGNVKDSDMWKIGESQFEQVVVGNGNCGLAIAHAQPIGLLNAPVGFCRKAFKQDSSGRRWAHGVATRCSRTGRL